MASLYIVSPVEAKAVGIVCVYLSEWCFRLTSSN